MKFIENLVDSGLKWLISWLSYDVQHTIIDWFVAERARRKNLLSFRTLQSLLPGILVFLLGWGITFLEGGRPLFQISEDWSFSNYLLLSGITLVYSFFMATFMQRDDSYGNLMFDNGNMQGISAQGNKSVGMFLLALFGWGILAYIQIFVLNRDFGLLNLLSLILLFVPFFMGDTLSGNARYEGTALTNLLLMLVGCAYLIAF